jgi:hypothetical protein
MKCRCVSLILALLLSVPISSAQAQVADDTISLGGFDLRLGMEQEDVLKRLTSAYEITHVEIAPGSWVVHRKGQRTSVVGSLSFDRGKLIAVNKQWGPVAGDQTASGLGTALFNAARALPAGTASSCTVSVTSFSLNSSVAEQTVIECGSRSLRITSGAQIAPAVTETIGSSR